MPQPRNLQQLKSINEKQSETPPVMKAKVGEMALAIPWQQRAQWPDEGDYRQ
jgi:hypothetical protein